MTLQNLNYLKDLNLECLTEPVLYYFGAVCRYSNSLDCKLSSLQVFRLDLLILHTI